MFIGHWAPAFAAAAASPRAPGLGTLFIAGQLVDWGFFALATVGVEKMRIVEGATVMNDFDLYHMPFTHSLAGTIGWAAGLALVIWLVTRKTAPALIGAAVVVSHWFLDLLVHRPDLTLAGGDSKLGLGLWNQPQIAIPLELALIGLCFTWYWRRTRGPALPAIILLVLLITMQGIDWLTEAPDAVGPGLYLLALFAFGLASLAAWWAGNSRQHRNARGLASSRARG